MKSLRSNLCRWNYFFATVLLISCGVAFGDAPAMPATIKTICNVSNSHCARTDPITFKTTLINQSSGAAQWIVPGYFRYLLLSNDGQAFIAPSDLGNFVPIDATKEHVLFYIYRDGKVLQTVKLGALFESPAKLLRTVSHLSWGYVEKIDANDNAVLSLSDGRKVSYSLITGLRLAQ